MEVWSPKCKLLTNKVTKSRWNLFQLETKNEAILVGFFNRKTKGSFKQWSTFFSSHENCWNGNPLIGVAQTAIFEMWPLNISFIASSFEHSLFWLAKYSRANHVKRRFDVKMNIYRKITRCTELKFANFSLQLIRFSIVAKQNGIKVP